MPPPAPERVYFDEIGDGVYCRLCSLEILKRDIQTLSGKHGRDGEAMDTEQPLHRPLDATAPGRYVKYNNTNAKIHLKNTHAIELGDPKTMHNSQKFFEACAAMKGKYGWGTFGCKADVLVIDMLKRTSKVLAKPIDDAIVYYLASSYTSFSQVENPDMAEMLRVDFKDMPSRKTIRRHAINLAEKLTDQYLKDNAGKVGKLTVDVGTVWMRYLGIWSCFSAFEKKKVALVLILLKVGAFQIIH